MVPFFVREGFMTVADGLMRLLEPVVESLGFELIEVELSQAGRSGVLRLYIDRMQGEPSGPAITVDDCARASHAVSEVLEEADPIKGHYTLEVSSPGFDRILRKKAHFDRFVGERVFVELKLPLDGRRRYLGELKSVADDAISVAVDGREYRLPFDRIQKARLRPE